MIDGFSEYPKLQAEAPVQKGASAEAQIGMVGAYHEPEVDDSTHGARHEDIAYRIEAADEPARSPQASEFVNEVLYRAQRGGDNSGMSRELHRPGSDRSDEARQDGSFRSGTRRGYGEMPPADDRPYVSSGLTQRQKAPLGGPFSEVIDAIRTRIEGGDARPWTEHIERLGPLATAGKEVKTFVTKTVKSLVKWGAERLVDLVAPGVGAAITTFEHIRTVAKAGEALVKGKGEVGVPVANFEGFEFKANVHVGDDPTGRELPVSAFIAPIDDASPLGGVEVEPDSEHRYAAMVPTDLSGLSRLPETAIRVGVIRSYTEQQVLPRLRRDHREEVELVYVIDKETGIGAWLHVVGETTDWCLLVWRNGQAKSRRWPRRMWSIS